MIGLVSFPLTTAGLFLLWLLLNESISLGHMLLGAAFALAGSRALRALELPRSRIRHLGAILQLAALVLGDIVRSNIAVGRIVLGLARPKRQSGFVEVPLDLRDPYGLAALAVIITSTPGTLWVSFDRATGVLLIHVLDLIDEGEWLRTIKGRYERLLLEIYE